MTLVLALVSVPLACAALVAAWRARAASHRLALEMVQLRDRLTAAEAGREAAEARAAVAAPGPAVDGNLVARLDQLEAELRAAQARAPLRAAPSEGCDDLRTTVEERLRLQGFRRVTFLETLGGGLVVEAERGGVTSKGRAEIRPDGTVHLRSISSVRAFP